MTGFPRSVRTTPGFAHQGDAIASWTVNNTGPRLSRLGGVDVLSWNPVQGGQAGSAHKRVDNFGDLLGPLLVERIAGLDAKQGVVPVRAKTPVLLTVGSILQFAPPGAVVWGSGVNFKLASKLPTGLHTLDIRSLRGPHSARAILARGGSAPDVFGDPALLLPRYLPELLTWRSEGRGGLLVAPNLNDFDRMAAEARSKGLAVVDPRAELYSVLRLIAESEFVVGSSLHAIVVADALGIPARFASSPVEGGWKYRDYLAGSGRPLTVIAEDIDHASRLGGHEPINVDLERLRGAFPQDLWGAEASAPAPAFRERASIRGAWEVLLQQPLKDDQSSAREFVTQVFPRLLASARGALSTLSRHGGLDASLEYLEEFSAAHAFRLALAPSVNESDLAETDATFLQVFDSGNADALLRRLWLEREGPHALMRSVSDSGGYFVFAIAVRPGALSNEIVSIEVLIDDSQGRIHTAEVPVFAMYQRQWTIDVCGAITLDPRTRASGARVRLTNRRGEVAVIPVQRAATEALSIGGYPHLSATSLWTNREPVEAASVPNGRIS